MMLRFLLSSAALLLGLAVWGCAAAPNPPIPTPPPPTTTPTLTTTPTTPPAAAIDAGALFQQYCLPCHGPDRKGVVGPDITAAGLQSRGRTDQYIRDTVSNGRNGMPVWKDKLTPAQIEALVAFLKT